MFDRLFVAYGVRIALRANCEGLLDKLEYGPEGTHLPFGWRAVEDHDPDAPVSVRYELLTGDPAGLRASYRLYADRNLIAETSSLTDLSTALAGHAEPFVAERSPDHLFVHAGVVGWQGRAILMPGASFAGKTTLVQAWLEAGAMYYSDEFAVLDRAGRVRPFARPLAIRDRSTGLTRRVAADTLGAKSGTMPLPVGLVLSTWYRPGARWRPRPLTAAPTLVALMRHTLAARGNPAHSMPILKQTVSRGTALVGPRGEAHLLVSALTARERGAGRSTPRVSPPVGTTS